jgi:hypothetical protein
MVLKTGFEAMKTGDAIDYQVSMLNKILLDFPVPNKRPFNRQISLFNSYFAKWSILNKILIDYPVPNKRPFNRQTSFLLVTIFK